MHLLKSLVYFEEAEKEPMPKMIKKVSFKEVKENILEEIKKEK